MSWDARLECSHGHVASDQNYTHNVNRMIRATGVFPGWWDELDGMTGEQAGLKLRKCCVMLATGDYDHLEPDNGWGSRKTLALVLMEMAQASQEHPDHRWKVSG